MNDLLKEAQEELERERWQTIWNRYKFPFFGIIAALVLGTAAWSWWDYDQGARMNESGATLLEAFSLPQGEARSEALKDTLDELPPRADALVKMLLAGQAIQSDSDDFAQTQYRDVAADTQADPLLRDLARVNHAGILLRKEEVKAADIREILEPLLQDQDSVWHGHALLYQALAEAHQDQNYAQAITHLEQIQTRFGPFSNFQPIISELLPLYQYQMSQKEVRDAE